MVSDDPVVSIVIPTFNSEKTLPLCLQSIKDQTYLNVEVVVVDNCSRDDTARIAKKFGTRVLLLASERSSARNLGAKKAQGSFIFFLDSDMELTPTVVEECVSVCLHKSVDAVNVNEISVGEGFVAESRKIEREMRIGSNVSEAPRFFRREVFDSVGGYDENLVSGEDFDLRRRIENAGYRIGRCKAEIRHHEGELSMRRMVLRFYYYGKSLSSFLRKNPSFAMKTSSPIHIVKNLKLINKYPIPFARLLFLKLFEYMTYAAGVLSNLLSTQTPKYERLMVEGEERHLSKLVLDIGSGDNPRIDATHLCDLYIRSNKERGGCLVIDDRPFVRCSVECLPFEENSFSFSYACHVLEHSSRPNLALAEITRVAKMGYIESPTYLAEYIYGWSFHNCSLGFKNGRILFYKSPISRQVINIHYISRKIILVRLLDYLLDCILGWHHLRVIWKKTPRGMVFKRVILRNPYKYLLIYIKHKGAHFSDLAIYYHKFLES